MIRSIAFDFDGVLSMGEDTYPIPATPNIELIDAAKRFQSKGWLVILYTAREGEHLALALDFLKEYGFTPDLVNENIPSSIEIWGDHRKIVADYYVDDRNISFNDAIAMSYRGDNDENKKVKEMWCLVDSVGPTNKDYMDDIKDAEVFFIVLKDNPTLLQTITNLKNNGCEVVLVFEQRDKRLYKKYLDKFLDYKTAIILDNDVTIPKLSITKFDYIIVDSDSIYYDCLNNLFDLNILFINNIPFRPFKGVKLDRPYLANLKARDNSIRMSHFVAHVFDNESDPYLLDEESTIKIDLSTDRIEAFNLDNRCVNTYNILDFLEERKRDERKANIHKRLPKTTATESKKEENLIKADFIRFQDGSGKVVLPTECRDQDVFIVCDVNDKTPNKYSGKELSPDDHVRDISRTVGALRNNPARINLVVPFQPYGRQHRRTFGESTEAADFLRECHYLGFKNILTVDSHDPDVAAAISKHNFDNMFVTNNMLATLIVEQNINYEDPESILIVAPDEGAQQRARHFADRFGCNHAFFSKRRDVTKIVDGKNPLESKQYVGFSPKGKTVIIVDDMIASGGTIIDTAKELKSMGASKIFICATFGLFTRGVEIFDLLKEQGIIDKVYVSNLTYRTWKKSSSIEVVDGTDQLLSCMNAMHNGKENITEELGTVREPVSALVRKKLL